MKSGPAESGTAREADLAAETAELAENLPDRAAIRSVVGAAMEIEHLADLLVSICLARTIRL